MTEALRKIATEGRTVIIATHDPELAELTDVALSLRDGRLREDRAPDKPAGARSRASEEFPSTYAEGEA
ncbi:MAG: hypothetical protein WD273_13245 [Trueperaceae bacterium]